LCAPPVDTVVLAATYSHSIRVRMLVRPLNSFDIGAHSEALLQSEDASLIYIDMNLLRRDETRAGRKNYTKLLSNLLLHSK